MLQQAPEWVSQKQHCAAAGGTRVLQHGISAAGGVFTLDSSAALSKGESCTRTGALCAPAAASPPRLHPPVRRNSFKELTTLHHYCSTFHEAPRPAWDCQKSDGAHGWRRDVGSGLGGGSIPFSREAGARSRTEPKRPISWPGNVQM